ncbi:hypothetical protein C8J57DRAFT_1225899 [Mycena rebaudengoi]|nr:hypothetical protein C8J57DRAFT_1225899 [Mycena rebaudengoi]
MIVMDKEKNEERTVLHVLLVEAGDKVGGFSSRGELIWRFIEKKHWTSLCHFVRTIGRLVAPQRDWRQRRRVSLEICVVMSESAVNCLGRFITWTTKYIMLPAGNARNANKRDYTVHLSHHWHPTQQDKLSAQVNRWLDLELGAVYMRMVWGNLRAASLAQEGKNDKRSVRRGRGIARGEWLGAACARCQRVSVAHLASRDGRGHNVVEVRLDAGEEGAVLHEGELNGWNAPPSVDSRGFAEIGPPRTAQKSGPTDGIADSAESILRVLSTEHVKRRKA